MPKFAFKFESLLKYRLHRRDLCRQVLSQILANDRRLAEQQDEMEQRRSDLLQQMRRLGSAGGIQIERLASRRYYQGQLQNQLREIEQNRNVVAQQIQICKDTLSKADQDVKILEKLKEKHLAEHNYYEERRANHELEETWRATQSTGAFS